RKFKEKEIEEPDFTIPKSWKTSKQHSALNYKVKIVTQEEVIIKPTSKSNAPMYFGDTGKAEIKSLSNTDKPLHIVIFSFQVDLLREIKSHFAGFLFQTNFGTRQSKGYGSFFL